MRKIIYFTKYTRQGASSRLRSYQFVPYLEDAGFSVKVSPLFSDTYINQIYKGKASKLTVFKCYINRFLMLFKVASKTKIVVEKELFPYLPAWAEQILALVGVDYIVDYDDAIFHNYDKSTNKVVRFFLKNKIDIVMRNSQYVIAGNSYLKKRAVLAKAKHVEIIPTVINLDRYKEHKKNAASNHFVIGWIGSPTTFKYVQAIAPVLKELAFAGARIHIIGAKGDLGFTKNVSFISWEETTEVENICKFDVGIMPLEDSPWEKGKCSYKLIQYMACGLPVVASPIGMNKDVVINNKNGYLVETESEWVKALNVYKNNKDLRICHGDQGYSMVVNNFTVECQVEKLKVILND